MIDKTDFGGTAAQGFAAKSSGACEQIQNATIDYSGGDDIKKRLPGPVGGGTDDFAPGLGGKEFTPPG
jgi:hypothetical protein